jgi:prepilin-type N-terminal cleavage/methylation domain-containing protein
MTCAHTKIRSRGFTIIELMITLVITSVLILGSVNFLVSARKSNNVQAALSALTSSGRFGLDQLTRDIRMAGYRDTDWTLGPMENVLSAVDGDAADGGDSLSVIYEARRNCAFGQPAVLNAFGVGAVTNVYQVVNGALQCNGQTITGGVQEMQIYFGEDTDASNVANRWVAPGTAGLDMARVVSVRIHLLARTNGNNVSTTPTPYRFDNAQRDAVDDGQIRREFSVTVALRNPT